MRRWMVSLAALLGRPDSTAMYAMSQLTSRVLRVDVVDGGIDIVSTTDGRAIATVRWRDVARIQTYKIDLWATDCICLLFEFAEAKPAVEVSEEWPGFSDLCDALAQAFPSIPREWYGDVVTPAFERNQRVLYEAS